MKESYHVAGLSGPPCVRSHNMSTTFGVTNDSILNTSRFFHVINGIPPDIMRDILEGTLQATLKCLLQYIISQEFLTLKLLNERIQSFNYGRVDSRNKPSVIKKDTLTSKDGTHLKQSGMYTLIIYVLMYQGKFVIIHLASQSWCLGRFIPLLVGDKVPEDDERWMNYLTLLHIMEFVFAPAINQGQIGYLEMLIEDFLYEFSRLYPDRPLLPKMHYLIHIPNWIRRYM